MKISSIFLSIVLSTLILFSSLRVSITYAYYELDPIGFIEKLCENKDKPELACNGKCHLKKVAESNTDNPKKPENFTSLEEIQLFVINKYEISITQLTPILNSNFDYKNLYTYSRTFQLDRPPQV